MSINRIILQFGKGWHIHEVLPRVLEVPWLCDLNLGANLGGGTESVFSVLPTENATGHYVKAMQRVPVRIDVDRVSCQTFNAEGLLKPELCGEPDVRVR